MNDDRLERELQAALLRDDPGSMSEELRRRVAAVPNDAGRGGGLVRLPRLPRLVNRLEALATVLVVAAVVVAALGLRGSNLGPVSSAPSPFTDAWHGLRWSAPTVIPDSTSIEDVVAWRGTFIAAGWAQDNTGAGNAAFWRSSDGTAWTRVGVDVVPFKGHDVFRHLLTTPSGLVAWGSVGLPACTGQGEGMKCGPFPVMFWTSPDGVSWARIPDTSTFAGATIDAVTVGAQGLVAVGDAGLGKPAIWVSATGSTWQRLTLPATTFNDAIFSDVRATASGFVVAGGVGRQSIGAGGVYVPDPAAVAAVWVSPDGSNWTKGTVQRANGVGTSLGSVYLGSHGMVAVGSASGGNGDAAWTSIDGRDWQPLAIPYLVSGMAPPAGVPTIPSFTICDDGTHLIASGVAANTFGVAMWASSDGLTWQSLAFSGVTTQPGDQGTIWKAFVVPGGLIVIGQQGSAPPESAWRLTALP
jgi:hypothetical protein